MATIKEILSENRGIVISSLMNITKKQDMKKVMVDFMAYCVGLEGQLNEMAEGNFKKEIVYFIVKFNLSVYPKKKIKLAEARADYMDRNNLEFDLLKKEYVKAI